MKKILLLALVAALYGCTPASVNSANVQAKAGAPASSQVATVSIPYVQGRPTYVVAVEPFVFTESAAPNDNTIRVNYRSGGESLAAQLTTALANVGNISVLDVGGLKKRNDGTYGANIKKGEKGPFVIRATVTEFNEVAEAASESSGGSLGWLGAIAGIAGAVADKPGLMWGGAGVAAANPTYQDDKATRSGMVAIDFRVVDGKTSRIIGAFKAEGTFKSEAAASGFSLFGIGKHSTAFAQSALGQAVRAALNDAVVKTNDTLVGRG